MERKSRETILVGYAEVQHYSTYSYYELSSDNGCFMREKVQSREGHPINPPPQTFMLLAIYLYLLILTVEEEMK
jgi:hypothetical protein